MGLPIKWATCCTRLSCYRWNLSLRQAVKQQLVVADSVSCMRLFLVYL